MKTKPTRCSCDKCRQPMIDIDYFGEQLRGCPDCNKWGKPRDSNLVMKLSDEDLEALRLLR